MRLFYLDASALVKRYSPEAGTDVVDQLFTPPLQDRLVASIWTITETAAALNRKRNIALIPDRDFLPLIRRMVAETDLFFQLKADSDDARQSMALIFAHNINASDALHLHLVLKLKRILDLMGDDIALVASDQRLLCAAQAEGVTTLDPETETAAGLQALL